MPGYQADFATDLSRTTILKTKANFVSLTRVLMHKGLATILIALGTVSCAMNKQIVFERESVSDFDSFENISLTIHESAVSTFSPMYGAEWELSGDITSLILRAFMDFEESAIEETQLGRLSGFVIEDIAISYGDAIYDGTHSLLFLTLSLELSIQVDGSTPAITCDVPDISPDADKPVSYSLFASEKVRRKLIENAYEMLIVKAFREGFFEGLKCLR